jgi:hypothetical protein
MLLEARFRTITSRSVQGDFSLHLGVRGRSVLDRAVTHLPEPTMPTTTATWRSSRIGWTPLRASFASRSIGLVCVILGCLLSLGAAAFAEPAVYQSFDGPDTLWKLLDPRPGVQIVGHGCVADDAREGTGSERITALAPAGESIHFACSVGCIPVLDEVDVRLWVKSNRPGVMLGARVVLPRSIDPTTHRPKTVFIEGSQYDQVDNWQQLDLASVPKLLAARIRVLRTAPGTKIDPHEAYLDAVTLIVPGGPATAAVWTDELVVDGVVASIADEAKLTNDPSVVQTAFVSGGDPSIRAPLVQIQDTTVFVVGKPFLPRGIRWNGEPLAFLAERGFNTVWTDRPPTADQTAEAGRADVWFVSTPPRPDALADNGLGTSLDRVLAWHLGTPGEHEVDYFRGWAELVREKDPSSHRPILIAPESDWLPCSKIADAVLASRPAAGSLTESEYAQWLDERALLARPGAPFWATVPSQPGQIVCDEMKALAPHSPSSPAIDERQIEALTRAAAIHGCRGFLIESTTPLNANEDATRRRALELESLNRSLQLLEPWLTLGTKVGRPAATGSATTATMLQVERTRLLILDARASDAGSPTKPSPPANATFIVPGVPDSNLVFLLSPASFQPLASKRVAGGVQVAVDRNSADMVLFTEDPNVISNFRQRVSRDGPKAARLKRDLVAARIKAGAADVLRLRQMGVDGTDYQSATSAANSQVARCDALLNSGNVAEAYRAASAAFTTLAQAEDNQAQKLVSTTPLTSLPVDVGASPSRGGSLSQQIELQKSLESLRPGENLLTGGDFEDLPQLMQLGWRHVSQPLPGVEPKAELSAQSPHAGRYCLQLVADAVPPAAAPQIVARPLVRITSPLIHVAPGDVLEISGWVRVPKPIVGNIDGLSIVDSLGGPELALRVRQSADWQAFRLVREATETSDETVSFVLNGLGAASVDDVAVRLLSPPTARRLPATQDRPPAPAPQSAGLPTLSAPLNQR